MTLLSDFSGALEWWRQPIVLAAQFQEVNTARCFVHWPMDGPALSVAFCHKYFSQCNGRLLTCYNYVVLVVFNTLLVGDIYGQAANNNGSAYFRHQ